jgi:hypothetical protein
MDTLTHPVPNNAKRDLSADLERERAVETALSMLRAAKTVQHQHHHMHAATGEPHHKQMVQRKAQEIHALTWFLRQHAPDLLADQGEPV